MGSRASREQEARSRVAMNKLSDRLAGLALSAAWLAMTVAASSQELVVGEPAPEFELMASDGREYSLTAFRGKQPVAIAFFPMAFTGG